MNVKYNKKEVTPKTEKNYYKNNKTYIDNINYINNLKYNELNNYNNNNNIKPFVFNEKSQNQNKNQDQNNNNNIIESHIEYDKKTEKIDFDNYSYTCLTKDLSFCGYQETKQEKYNLTLKNDGIFPWPKNSSF